MYNLIIVDDEPIMWRTLSAYIENNISSFSVDATFSDAFFALDYIKSNPVDVVITDVRMPQMSGLDLAKHIHQTIPSCHTIIISGYREFDYAKEAIKHNVFNYLLKPIDFDELHDCLLQIEKRLSNIAAIHNLDIIDVTSHNDFSTHKQPSLKKQKNLLNKDEDIIIQTAKEYIYMNYAHDLTRDEVAEAVFLSPSYFSRVFKAKTGSNFSEFLTSVRIEKAMELLKKNVQVNKVANMVGYQSRNSFFVNFKSYTSYTPSEYRKIILKMEGDYN